MGTLGQYLREMREARGVDLRDAAQQTRISLQYLKALEEEKFAKLPGEVFVRGFLKSYGKFLQLDVSELMAKYEELKPPKTNAAAAPSSGGDQTAGPVEEQPSKKVPIPVEPFVWAGGILIALVVFILLVVPVRHPRKAQTTAILPQAGQMLSTATTTVSKSEKLYLEIVALENTWLLLRTDNSPQKKAVLTKGETLTWSADERFQLSYGNAGALKLTVNGKELTVNEPKNAVVRDMTITASGIMNRKVHFGTPKSAQQKPRHAPLLQQPRPLEQQQVVKPKPVRPLEQQQVIKPKPVRPSGQQQVIVKPKPAQPSRTQPPRTQGSVAQASAASTTAQPVAPQSRQTLTR